MAHVDTNAKHGLFLHEHCKYADKAFDEDIIENNYMFVMLCN